MVADHGTGFAQSHNFGMGRGVVAGKVAIPAACDDSAVANDNGAHGNFAGLQRALGGTERLFHEKLVAGRWLLVVRHAGHRDALKDRVY
jgi:hypothetical protein